MWSCDTTALVKSLQCGGKKQDKTVGAGCSWDTVPDETEALETEMVGVPEFVLWWPAAFFSGALSMECKLATLSAPSGYLQTQIHFDLDSFPRCVALCVCLCVYMCVCISCWPWPSGCRWEWTICPGFGIAGCWVLWASLMTPRPPHCPWKPGRNRFTTISNKYLAPVKDPSTWNSIYLSLEQLSNTCGKQSAWCSLAAETGFIQIWL